MILFIGPPSDEEIDVLAKKLSTEFLADADFEPPHEKLHSLCRALELDEAIVKEIISNQDQSESEMIRMTTSVLKKWREFGNNTDTDRTKLKEALNKAKLSSFSKYIN